MDMTADLKNEKEPWHKAEQIAKEIKTKIRKKAGEWISCSVGIGPNKLVAKIASDMQKPDGLVVVPPEEKYLLYDKLKLTDIPGIAKSTEHALNMIGIKTLKDLRDYPAQNLFSHFGIMGYHLHKIGQLEAS